MDRPAEIFEPFAVLYPYEPTYEEIRRRVQQLRERPVAIDYVQLAFGKVPGNDEIESGQLTGEKKD